MNELDIELIAANTPQAKGRVERANKTLQDRLIKEMRLLGISSMKEGNNYLLKYMKIFNKRFSVDPRSNINAHRQVLKEQRLDEILCWKDTRVLSKNLTMQYKNKTYQLNLKPEYSYTMRRTKVNVIEKTDGSVLISYRGKVLNCSIIEIVKSTKVYSSKGINKKVDELQKKKGFQLQFNLLGRTFSLWRKPDISTLG